MKKAIKINLAGIIFHIDEDAYEKLQNYLSALTYQFGNNDEAKEIVSDIESRIAELLQTKLVNRQVVEIADIEYVITILGKPDDYNAGNDANTKRPNFEPSVKKNNNKKFYRDIDNSVFGGVCSGLGAYFNIDPVIMRLIFVLLFFVGGATLLIYLILWIALPAARTAAQKLEMRGEDVNLSNIEKTVRSEYDQYRDGKTGSKGRDFFHEFFHVLGNFIKMILKIVGAIIGIVLVIVGIVIIIAIVAVSSGGFWGWHGSDLQMHNFGFILHQFAGNWSIVAKLAFISMIAIPVLGILYLGLKLIFKFKIKDRPFWLGAIGLWIISIILFFSLIVSNIKSVSKEGNKSVSLQMEVKQYQKLYLQINPNSDGGEGIESFFETDGEKEYFLSKDDRIFGRPKLTIEKSDDASLIIDMDKKARGSSYSNASDNATAIQYDAMQKDSIIMFDKYFSLSENNVWRAQQLDVILRIPVGTKIYIDNNLKGLLEDANVNGSYWMHELPGKTWIMTENGLEEEKF
jgi:phage shock protein PspC (stress-responsive transcriptional regulator)